MSGLGRSYYVYALKDPRGNPAKPFYVGKGTGIRAWEHELKADSTRKGKRIKEIQETGAKVLISKLADELTENEALRIEAELISAFWIETKGGLLTNSVIPLGIENSAKLMTVNVPAGLQSDYLGGSKDYLSWSILGILMREGKLKRVDKKRHKALVR